MNSRTVMTIISCRLPLGEGKNGIESNERPAAARVQHLGVCDLRQRTTFSVKIHSGHTLSFVMTFISDELLFATFVAAGIGRNRTKAKVGERNQSDNRWTIFFCPTFHAADEIICLFLAEPKDTKEPVCLFS